MLHLVKKSDTIAIHPDHGRNENGVLQDYFQVFKNVTVYTSCNTMNNGQRNLNHDTMINEVLFLLREAKIPYIKSEQVYPNGEVFIRFKIQNKHIIFE